MLSRNVAKRWKILFGRCMNKDKICQDIASEVKNIFAGSASCSLLPSSILRLLAGLRLVRLPSLNLNFKWTESQSQYGLNNDIGNMIFLIVVNAHYKTGTNNSNQQLYWSRFFVL